MPSWLFFVTLAVFIIDLQCVVSRDLGSWLRTFFSVTKFNFFFLFSGKYYDVTIHSSKKAKELSLSFIDTYKIQVNEHLVKLFQYDLSVCLYYWPLHYIRSYKVRKDWNCFVLHSGRRCMSGEGELCFQFLIHGEAEKFYNTVLSTSSKYINSDGSRTEGRGLGSWNPHPLVSVHDLMYAASFDYIAGNFRIVCPL